MPIPREQRAVQSVEVGGRLLLALAGNPAPMALKDLAAAADLPPSRAHPYLVSFGKLGLIEQLNSSGMYALGPAALQLGLTYLYQLDPTIIMLQDLVEGRLFLRHTHCARLGHADAMSEPAAPRYEPGQLPGLRVVHWLDIHERARKIHLGTSGVDEAER